MCGKEAVQRTGVTGELHTKLEALLLDRTVLI